jgi:hypothetical protein
MPWTREVLKPKHKMMDGIAAIHYCGSPASLGMDWLRATYSLVLIIYVKSSPNR